MIENSFINQGDYNQKRIYSKLQLLEFCIIIQTMPFNSIMNINYG